MKDKYVFNSVFSLERYCNGWAGMTHLFSLSTSMSLVTDWTTETPGKIRN